MNRTTKECRAGLKCEPISLVEAAKCLLLHSVQPIEDIAVHVKRSENYLRKASNADYSELQLQADTIDDATAYTRNLVVLQHMARRSGAVVIALPNLERFDNPELRAAFMRTTKELGDACGQLEESLGNDGQIDLDEGAKILRSIDEHIEASMVMKQAVRHAMAGAAQKGGTR